MSAARSLSAFAAGPQDHVAPRRATTPEPPFPGSYDVEAGSGGTHMAVSRASTARARSYPGGHQSQTGSRWTFTPTSSASAMRATCATSSRRPIAVRISGRLPPVVPHITGRLVWAREKRYNTAKARRANGYVDRPLLPSEQRRLVGRSSAVGARLAVVKHRCTVAPLPCRADESRSLPVSRAWRLHPRNATHSVRLG